MKRSLEKLATDVLLLLARIRGSDSAPNEVDGPTLVELTGAAVADINDAFWLLKNAGYVDSLQYLETVDFNFTKVWITALGRYEAERLNGMLAEPIALKKESPVQQPAPVSTGIALPPTPVGSPYGFTDEDWEVIALQKSHGEKLYVVMGLQFKSTHYETEALQRNVRAALTSAVERFNLSGTDLTAQLVFRPLAAGYGEHLFNDIARDIIAADIAVFDTSDMNPNVMLELGVALTWGVRVLPIRHHATPPPPSDISGQTWALYENSAAAFLDPDHSDKLVRMVERAVRKKGRRQ